METIGPHRIALRRWAPPLLVLLFIALLPASGEARASAADGLALTEPPRHRTLLPLLASDGHPTHFAISAGQANQGGTLRVAADQGQAGTVTVFGRSYPLEPGPGGVAGYVGFGIFDPPGTTTVTARVSHADGLIESWSWPVLVLKTDWTVDYIILPPPPPPDPGAPPPPPPPPNEEPLLPGIYAGISPRRWKDGWGAPLPQPFSITGYFGEQRSFNGGPVGGHHGGTDFGAAAGTPISATNDGVVVLSGLYRTRGNLVIVDHGSGVFSLYGHMQERAVAVGAVVTKGEVLGYVGTTGLSTGPHLHWEMSVGGVLVDALRWLDGSQGF